MDHGPKKQLAAAMQLVQQSYKQKFDATELRAIKLHKTEQQQDHREQN